VQALRKPALWLYVGALFLWGLVVLLFQDPTLRETSFTLLMYVGLASSLNILLGYTGYVSFGHIVFFGLGGYLGFYLVSVQGLSLYPAALIGGVFCGGVAALLGLAVLRLRGAYFALATIGVNEAARAFVSNFGPFGGATGLSLDYSVYGQYGGSIMALWLAFVLVWLTAIAVVITSLPGEKIPLRPGPHGHPGGRGRGHGHGGQGPPGQDLGLCAFRLFPGDHRHHLFFQKRQCGAP
jgi:branched-chain amino acid transport system permease protein